ALIVVEVAVSLVVLTGAGLLLRSFVQLSKVDSGVVSENLLTANIGFVQFKDPERRAEVEREVLEKIALVPGVITAAGGTGLPPDIAQRGTRFAVPGLTEPGAEQGSLFIAVSPDYFKAIGASLVEGRWFNERDKAGSEKVVVISRALARSL